MTNRIEFDRELYLSLKDKYADAVREEREQFSLKGHIILTSYAKYLIQHLSSEFENVEKGDGK